MENLPGWERGPMAILSLPVSDSLRSTIASKTMVHRAPSKYRKSICGDTDIPSEGKPCTVALEAASGWQWDGWKIIRDLTVADLNLSFNASHGKYRYFFVGEPSAARKKANAGETHKSSGADIYRVNGQSLLAQCDEVFYRSFDKVLAVRGSYNGPATVTPE